MKRLVIQFDPSDVAGSEAKWHSLVQVDPELVAVDELSGRDPRTNAAVLVSRPGSAKWLGHPDAILAFLIREAGGVVASWADQSVEAKVMAIASELGLVVSSEVAD